MNRPPAPGHSPVAVAVDPRLLSAYLGEDASVQTRFLQAFLSETERSVDNITRSLARSDLLQARAEAHRLRPSATVVGAQRLAQLCVAIEFTFPETGYLPILASQLRAEARLVEVGIERFLEQHTS